MQSTRLFPLDSRRRRAVPRGQDADVVDVEMPHELVAPRGIRRDDEQGLLGRAERTRLSSLSSESSDLLALDRLGDERDARRN